MPQAVESRRSGIPTRLVVAVILISLLVIGAISWLIYVHHASAGFADRWTFLPVVEAVLNALAAAALLAGFYFIRRHRVRAHRNSMAAAFVISVLFLATYTTNHALHGDMYFQGVGALKTTYLSILASHIVLSAVALPLVLITFFFALTRRFRRHRAIARFTLPIWLYVSVTGVVVYLMLEFIR